MSLRVVLFCLLGGLTFLLPALGAGHLFWWYLSGVVLAAAFVPVALFGPRTIWGQFGVVFSVLLIVTVVTTWSEALLFVKVPAIQEHPFRNLASEIVMYLLVSVVLVVLARILKLTHGLDSSIAHRSIEQAALMVTISALAYMIYYLVFGAITYQYFTKGYYPNAAAQVAPLGLWFWAIQFGRGLLMTLAVVPAIYAIRLKRWEVAICAGLLMWVAGGLSPLLIPNELMVGKQRFIHIIEIFTQNFTLGVTAGLLLRPENKAGKIAGSLSASA